MAITLISAVKTRLPYGVLRKKIKILYKVKIHYSKYFYQKSKRKEAATEGCNNLRRFRRRFV